MKLHESIQRQLIRYDEFFAYTLDDDVSLQPSDHVMINNRPDNFISCSHVKFNGHNMLYYINGSYKPLSERFNNSLKTDDIISITHNLLESIKEVKDTGLLSCKMISVHPDNIFIDSSTLKTFLVYFPINKSLHDDMSSFDEDVKSVLCELITTNPFAESTEVADLLSELRSDSCSFNDIYERRFNPDMPPKLIFSMINNSSRILEVTDSEFIIDSKNNSSFPFGNSSDHVRCVITRDDQHYWLNNLDKSSSVILNNVSLQSNVAYPIINDDTVKLAGIDFRISIG